MIGKVPDEGRPTPEGAVPGAGRLIGRRYRLLAPVGRGAMGVVWHAHDVLLDRDVAVKELILPSGFDRSTARSAHRRVLQEARSAARLTHPGIVTVHDVVEDEGRPWIVMELVRAWSLEQALRQSGPLPVPQAAEIGIRVLDALTHAHTLGILHRDIKPGNVLLTADRVVLTDFGIGAIEGDVSVVQAELMMGSPCYVPPERISGQRLTPASDLWSFGATMYATVEGRPPYEGPDTVTVLGAILTKDPYRPGRAGALLPLLEGLLRKNPAERMTAAEVRAQLEGVLRGHGSKTVRELPAAVPQAAPAHLLLPLDPPAVRILETPSGPVRVQAAPGAAPHDSFSAPGSPGFDAFDSMDLSRGDPALADLPGFDGSSGPFRIGGAYDLPGFDETSGAHRLSSFNSPAAPKPFGGPSGAHRFPEEMVDPMPVLPPGIGSRDLRSAADGDHVTLAPKPYDDGSVRQAPRRAGTRGKPREEARTRHGRRSPSPGNGWVRGGRPTVRLVVCALAAVGVAVAALLLVTSGGTPGAAPAGTTSVPLRPEPVVAQVPDGFKEHAPEGFSVAVPISWKLSTDGGVAAFTGPKDSGLKITVEKAKAQLDGGISELSRREKGSGVDAYLQVKLEGVKYRAWKAADWEYTYSLVNEVPMHALTRYVTLDDRSAVVIAFTMPELRWSDEAPTRQTFLDTFRPTA